MLYAIITQAVIYIKKHPFMVTFISSLHYFFSSSSFLFLILYFSGKITYYTHPPEQHSLPSHIDASIVTQLGQEFNVASLEKEDDKILKGMWTWLSCRYRYLWCDVLPLVTYLIWHLCAIIPWTKDNFAPSTFTVKYQREIEPKHAKIIVKCCIYALEINLYAKNIFAIVNPWVIG